MDLSQSSQQQTTSRCGICYETMSNYGVHQVVCLRCGHLFCIRCITRALSSRKICPVCQEPARKADIRRLFLQDVQIKDELQIHDLRTKLDSEINIRKRAEEREKAKDDRIRQLEEQIRQLRGEVSNNSSNSTIAPSNSTSESSQTPLSVPDCKVNQIDFQLKAESDFAVDSPRLVIPDVVDQFGGALPTASSLYFVNSEKREVSLLNLQNMNSSTLAAHFDKAISSLSVFPLSSHVLISAGDTAHILDTRQGYIAGSARIQEVSRCFPSHSPFQFFSSGPNGVDVFDCRFLNRPTSHISCFSTLNLFPITDNMLVQVSAHRIVNWVFLGDSWTSNGDISHHHRKWRAAAACLKDDQFFISCFSEDKIELIKGVSNKLAFAFSSVCSLNRLPLHEPTFYSTFFHCPSNPIVISDFHQSNELIHYYAMTDSPHLCAVSSRKFKDAKYSFGFPGSDHVTRNIVIVTPTGINIDSIINNSIVCSIH